MTATSARVRDGSIEPLSPFAALDPALRADVRDTVMAVVAAFETALGSHAQVGPLIARNRGLRVPLAATPFEALAWAIAGQQISVGDIVGERTGLVIERGAAGSIVALFLAICLNTQKWLDHSGAGRLLKALGEERWGWAACAAGVVVYQVDDDGGWFVEGTDEVLARLGVDPRLAAYCGIDHGQQGGRSGQAGKNFHEIPCDFQEWAERQHCYACCRTAGV